MSTDNWYLLYTKSRKEKVVEENLKNQGYSTFLPKIKIIDLDATSREYIMFPRYIFVSVDLVKSNWSNLRYTKGVSHLVSFSEDKPAVVPDEVIRYLKKLTDKDGTFIKRQDEIDFEYGDKIVIKEGIFKGKEGKFLSERSEERIEILMELINSNVQMNIHKSIIEHKKEK